MKTFWQMADWVFLVLLTLEMAAAGLFLLDLGLGRPWGLQCLISLEETGTLPVIISSAQLATIGLLFLRSIRQQATANQGPSCVFLVVAGIFFLGLAFGRAGGFLRDFLFHSDLSQEGFRIVDPFAWLPVALLFSLLLFRAAHRSFAAMWRFFTVNQ